MAALRSVLEEYRQVGDALRAGAAGDAAAETTLDDQLGRLEDFLEQGACETPDDVVVKLLYVRETVQLDPALLTVRTIDTLMAGVARFLPVAAAAA